MNQKNDDFNDEIDLKELFLVLWDKKNLIILITSIFAITSIIVSLLLPSIYTSKSILAEVSSGDSMSSKLGSFSSLASLGGFSIPGEGATKGTEAIERIKSFQFFSTYFLPNIKLENMMAVKRWDSAENNIVYDDSIFDKKNNSWVREGMFRSGEPSAQEAFQTYREILSISKSKETQFVTLSIDHYSPIIAKQWVELIIYSINESMREEDKKKAESAIIYLNETIRSTNVQTLKEATSRLLESQMQVLMLSASDKAYVFKVLDAPITPELRTSPKRTFLVILGTLLGGILSVLIVLIFHYAKGSKQ